MILELRIREYKRVVCVLTIEILIFQIFENEILSTVKIEYKGCLK